MLVTIHHNSPQFTTIHHNSPQFTTPSHVWSRYDSDAVRCTPASANAKRGTIDEGEEGEDEGDRASDGTGAASVPTPAPTTPAQVVRTPRRIGSGFGDESDCSSNGSVSDDEGFS